MWNGLLNSQMVLLPQFMIGNYQKLQWVFMIGILVDLTNVLWNL